MPFVTTVPYCESDGEIKATYDQMLGTRGRIANVMAVSSLRPHLMKTLSAHMRSTVEPGGMWRKCCTSSRIVAAA